MKLSKLMPIVAIVFTLEKEKGISSSEANRLKESLKNKNNPQLQKLEGNLYTNKREILSANGVTEQMGTLENQVTVEDFNCLEQISKDHARSAKLGQAIKLIDIVRNRIVSASNGELAGLYEIPVPVTPIVPMPSLKQATTVGIDAYCNLDKAEELFRAAGAELINECGGLLDFALQYEAQASVYGKQIHTGSFLRELANGKESVASTETNNGSIIVYNTKVLAYDKNTFKPLDEELQEKYNQLQMQRNSVFKQVKDAARRIQLQYNEEYRVAVTAYSEAIRLQAQETEEFNSQISKLKMELQQELAAFKILA